MAENQRLSQAAIKPKRLVTNGTEHIGTSLANNSKFTLWKYLHRGDCSLP